MTELELFIAEQIKELVPSYETVELNATISSSGFSVEFFATVDGKKRQCFEMIDEGMFTEKEFNAVSEAIADYCRGLSDFNKDGINKYTAVIKK